MRKIISGSYSPSFYYIKFDTNDSLGSVWGTPSESTLVHEYVHLLQDITLPSCMSFTRQKINNFRGLSSYICNSNKPVSRPVEVNNHMLELSNKISDMFWGNDKFVSNAKIIRVTYEEITISLSPHIEIPQLKLYLENNGTEEEYIVGFRDFAEGLAALVEEHIYGDQKLPDYPYKTIYNILKHYDIEVTSKELAKLIELAMLYQNPVSVFVNHMYEYKDDIVKMTDYDNYSMHTKIYDHENNMLSTDQYIENTYRDVMYDLSEWFNRDFCTDIHEWIRHLYETGYTYRKNRLWISDIINQEPELSRILIVKCMFETGIPLLINKNNDMYTLGEHNNKYTFDLLGLEAVEGYLTSTDIFCKLDMICEKYVNKIGDVINKNCRTNPVSKVNEDRLCSFALWIKSLGFTGKI